MIPIHEPRTCLPGHSVSAGIDEANLSAMGEPAPSAAYAPALRVVVDSFDLVPAFARRCLHIGGKLDWVHRRCSEGIEELWCADHPEVTTDRFSPGYFDVVLLTGASAKVLLCGQWLASLAVLLAPEGLLSIVFSNDTHRMEAKSLLDKMGEVSGLAVYDYNLIAGTIRMVSAANNPVKHARRMAAEGRPDTSIEILANIPEKLIVSEDMIALIAAEKQQYYLAWQKKCDSDPLHSWFSKSQREFAQATAIDSGLTKAYQTQAEYWHFLGDQETGKAVWRSFLQSSQSDWKNTDYRSDGSWKRPAVALKHTEVKRNLPNPGILVLGHSLSDYGMDTLYDGLCRVVGSQNVAEYPIKPTLHGLDFESTQSYPCTFVHPRGPSSLRELIARLEAGRFDIILYADVVEMNRGEEIRRLLEAAAGLPLIVYDSWDDCHTPMKAVLEYIDRPQVDMVFNGKCWLR